MEIEEETIKKVQTALKSIFEKDCVLIDINVNERSIAHKLAEHLQNEFRNFNVDCEYNRHGDDSKTLKYQYDELPGVYDLEAKTVFPDIVIHERGNDESNLLVVEIKKSNSAKSHIPDHNKLKYFTGRQYRYEVGLFLLFDINRKCLSDIQCFIGGKEKRGSIWDKLKGFGNI